MLVEMAALCNGEVIYFSLDPELPVINEHRAHGTKGIGSTEGKRAVMVRDGEILLVNGANELPLAKLADIPLTSWWECDPGGREYSGGSGHSLGAGYHPGTYTNRDRKRHWRFRRFTTGRRNQTTTFSD